MAFITLLTNPLSPNQKEVFDYTGRLIDFLRETAPDGFGRPVHCWLNNNKILLENFDVELKDDDVVLLLVMPGTGAEIAWGIVKIVAMMAISYAISRVMMDRIHNPDFADQPEANSVYSLSAGQNVAKIGEPIPVIYGRVTTTPDYASQPYRTFDQIDISSRFPSASLFTWNFAHPNRGPDRDSKAPLPVPVYLYKLKAGSAKIYERMEPDGIFNDRLFPPEKFARWIATDPNYMLGGSWVQIPESGGQITRIRRHVAVRDGHDGDQWSCQMLSLGYGQHDIHKVFVAGTDAAALPPEDFKRVDLDHTVHKNTYGAMTWVGSISFGGVGFHENVDTAVEVAGLEFTEPRLSNYFPVSKRTISRIAVDIEFPRGLYKIDNYGNFQIVEVEISIRYRIVGTPGAQSRSCVFANLEFKNISPFRRTLHFEVAPGVYEVAIQRLTAGADKDGKVQDALVWTGLKGYVSETYTNIYNKAHLMAVRIKATDLVSSASQNMIQVQLSRKQTRLDGSFGRTSNPVDHVYDIMKLSGRPDKEMDIDLLKKLRTRWTHKAAWGASVAEFNGVFNGRTIIFDALKTALQPVNARPMPIGGEISVEYDGVKNIRRQMFTENNMVMDSFSINYNFDKVGAHDGFILEYRDPELFEPIYETWPAAAVDPQLLNLFGCTSKTQALEMAKFLWNQRRLIRKTVEFQTELEGLIAVPGDRICIQHTLASWGENALVMSWDAATRTMKINPKVSAASAVIMLRNDEGGASGPITVTMTDEKTAVLTAAPTIPIRVSTDISPTLCSFGSATTVVEDFIVLSANHNGDVSTTITAINYDPAVYDNTAAYLKEVVT